MFFEGWPAANFLAASACRSVFCIFCFPVSVWQVKGINDFTVGRYPSFLWGVVCLFAAECEIGLSAVVLEKALECSAHRAFVLFAEVCVFFEFNVVVFYRFVRGFDIEGWHSDCWLPVVDGWVMSFLLSESGFTRLGDRQDNSLFF